MNTGCGIWGWWEACEAEAMKAEQDWLALAAKVKSYLIEDNELLLVDETGATLATLAPKIDGFEFKLSKNDSDMLEWGLKDFTAEPKS